MCSNDVFQASKWLAILITLEEPFQSKLFVLFLTLSVIILSTVLSSKRSTFVPYLMLDSLCVLFYLILILILWTVGIIIITSIQLKKLS